MSEKRVSEGSGNWRLTSLFRPISQLSLPRSNRTSNRSFQEAFPPAFSLSIPSYFGRLTSIIPEPDEALLIAKNDEEVGDLEGNNLERSPSECASTFEPAKEEADEIKPISGPQKAVIAAAPQKPPRAVYARRVGSRSSISSRSTRRPESRDTEHLAELPALPPKLRSVRVKQATISEHSSVKHLAERRESIRPPVPSKAQKDEEADPNLVSWSGQQDPENALNWSNSRKWTSTLALAFVTFCVNFASSCLSPAVKTAATEYGVASEVMVLATTLFMLGLAVGPFVWSPLIEICGRKKNLFFGLAGFAIFQIPAAVAQNIETVLVCRLFQGVFGCSPLIAVVASLTDLWTSVDRGHAFSVFSATMFIGISSGALVGAPVTDSGVLGWKWNSWIVLILCFPFGMACWMVYKESSAAVLLQRRVKVLRRSTNNWALHSPIEEEEPGLRMVLAKHVRKPILMLASDSILLAVTAYMSFAYGIMYLVLEAYPLSFVDQRYWPLRLSGLPFLAIIVGVCIGCLVDVAFTKARFHEMVRKYGRLCPEERLLPMLVGGVALPFGLFLSAWTSAPGISPVPEVIAGVPLGIGFLLIFLEGNMYIIEVFGTHASSAIAVNTSVRSLAAVAFPAFARSMYLGLEPQWAGTVLAILAMVFLLVPMTLLRYGVKFRAMSKWTPKLAPGSGSSPTEGYQESKW
ncbi:hypothetical protein M409DRAFT_62553 [Zasmidium cellare ATCC 36951]|uniref:Major facilitator superfamily (MFS) profile domain-containing protein n=1 Tax=Zasmidium cellare ATCC 36951 TaxID=1080233 RepID=A0A6A6D0E5_ZASCE|nr:uncharacterized protein M409DRAFT_62553 [Zasmidium cellare ATCC 36951]KAF2172894.1 hypothetical protein M409DRAFT_62553 [Zasmidium cellare ATCC 36951]